MVLLQMVPASLTMSSNIRSGFEVLACSIDTDFNYTITNALESSPRSDISNPKLPLPALSPTNHLLGGKNGLIKVLF